MTLHPYKPIPWESFTLIPTPRRRYRSKRLALYLALALIALAVGALVAAHEVVWQ